nr:hypothetical protein [Tanacetum cinerariifolium]
MESLSPQVVSAAKLPIFNPNEFDLWKMRIEQYFLMTDYSLWEVILNGDSSIPTRVIDGVVQPVAPTTAKQRLARKNKLKARGTLLMALPDKHQLKFNNHKDAKTLMEAIEKRLCGNKETKKVQKTLFKQQYENFSGSILKKSTRRVENSHPYLEEQDRFGRSKLDDLFNSLKIYEAEVKSSFTTSPTTQNIAFVSSQNTDSTNELASAVTSVSTSTKVLISTLPNVDTLSDAVIYSLFASQYNSPQLDNDDLKQIDADDLEEMEFKWQMAMLTMRARSMMVLEAMISAFRQKKNQPTMSWYSPPQVLPVLIIRDNALVKLSKKFKKAEQERDKLKLKLENFQTYSKNLSKLLASQITDKTGLGYYNHVFNSAVFGSDKLISSESDVRTFMPPKPDLVFHDAPTINETVLTVSDSEDEPEGEPMPIQKAPSFVQTSKHVKTPRTSVKPVEHPILAENVKKDIPTSRGHRHSWNRKACFVCKSLTYLIKDCDYCEKKMVQKPVRNHPIRGNHQHYERITHPQPHRHVVPITFLTKYRLVPLTVARPVTIVVPQTKVQHQRPTKHGVTKAHSPSRRPINLRPSPTHSTFPQKVPTIKAPRVNDVQDVKGNLQHALKDKGVTDSGCSRHMTGNISYLSDFEEINGGYVAFGGNPKGELKFNIFSVSQMYDKKNIVLFIDTSKLDDLFNSLKIYEAEVKSSSTTSPTTQNIAFVSSQNTNSTNESVSVVASVFAASTKVLVSALPNQIDTDDLEEMDLKWQMAMLTMRAKRFLQRTGRNLRANGTTSIGFDMNKETHRRNVPVETSTSNALVSQCDGVRSYDWSFQAEEELTNYALMAFTFSSSSSYDNEVASCSKACTKAYATLQSHYDKLTNDLRKDNSLVDLRKKFKKSKQERDELKLKLDKFQTSSKNLSQLLASQTSDKTRLGYDNQVINSTVFDCDEMFSSEFDVSMPTSPIYDRYKSREGYHDIPPPYTGTFMSSKPDLVFHDEANKWHIRLGHVNFKNLNKLVKENLVRGIPSKIFENDHTCVASQKRKQHKAFCKAKTVSFVNHPLQILHMDLFEPTSVRSINHNTYYLVITDGFSRSDNGTEFKNHELLEFCGLKGIKKEYSNARTPQQNGVAKMKNKTLIKAARTMSADSFLPTTFWAEAVNTTCYVLNRVLVTKPQNKTPYELLISRQLIISYLRPFGFHVTILNTIDQLGKFDGKSDLEFLVGYSLNRKAFRVYNLETKSVEENLHADFLENKPNVVGKGHAWMFDLDYLTNSMNYKHVLVENQANKSAGPKEANNNACTKANDDQGANTKEINLHDEQFVLPIWSAYSTTEKEANDAVRKDTTHENQNANTNSTNQLNDVSTPISTVGPSIAINNGEPSYSNDPLMPHLEDIYASPSERIFTDPSYDDEGMVSDFNNLETTVIVSPTPTTRIHTMHPKNQILRDPLSAIQTRSKVHKNFEAHTLFQIQKVWILVDLHFRKKAIGTKWVYRNKKDEREVVVRNKARLVAQRHRQEEGIDYNEVFAHVAKIDAIRIFLAFASYMGFIVYQMDVKSAFMYETIDEVVCVTQPLGFVDPKFPNKVCKVVKALYGLHQAPRAWYATLSTFLEKSRYRIGAIDKTLFIKQDIMLVQVYVDDIIFGSTKKSWCDQFEELMKNSVKTASTLIETQKPLLKDEKAVVVDVHLYRFQVTPKTLHLQAVKRIFRYLKGQPKLGLWYPKVLSFNLEAYSDSDYAGTNLDRKSTT